MQTIKGLIALLLVAVAAFASAAIYNSKTEPTYEANLKKATMAEAVKPAPHTVAAAKASLIKTSPLTRQKIKNTSL